MIDITKALARSGSARRQQRRGGFRSGHSEERWSRRRRGTGRRAAVQTGDLIGWHRERYVVCKESGKWMGAKLSAKREKSEYLCRTAERERREAVNASGASKRSLEGS